MKPVLVAINARYSHTNLAVRYLRQALQEAGIGCEIAEHTINQPVREIVADIAQRQPSHILFSCYLWNIDYVRRAGSDLRRLFPSVPILLGGPEVSFDSEALLKQLPFAGAIISGEGEPVIADAVKSNGLHGVYRAKAYVNLDKLAFPYDDLADLQHRVLYYESSRGCPFGCSYCLSSADRQVRTRSLPLVFSDLQRFLDAGVMQVKFVDRTFNLDASRAIKIWSYLMEHDNGKTSFQMEIGADLLTEKQLALLSKARPNLFQFEAGVQSTKASVLEAVCRPSNLKKLQQNMRKLRQNANIHCHLDLIAGLPGESFLEFLKSYDDVFAMHPQQLQLGFLKLLRGSRLYQEQESLGLACSMYPPYEILSTPSISFPELVKLKQLEEMTEIYYNSGRFALELGYLLSDAPSPARFFLSLADTLPKRNISKYEYYDLLYAFSQSLHPGEASLEKLRWLMRADLCLHERPRKLPISCPPGNAQPYRREIAALGLPKEWYADVFPFDFSSPHAPEKPLIVAFDYKHRSPNGNAAFHQYPLP